MTDQPSVPVEPSPEPAEPTRTGPPDASAPAPAAPTIPAEPTPAPTAQPEAAAPTTPPDAAAPTPVAPTAPTEAAAPTPSIAHEPTAAPAEPVPPTTAAPPEAAAPTPSIADEPTPAPAEPVPPAPTSPPEAAAPTPAAPPIPAGATPVAAEAEPARAEAVAPAPEPTIPAEPAVPTTTAPPEAPAGVPAPGTAPPSGPVVPTPSPTPAPTPPPHGPTAPAAPEQPAPVGLASDPTEWGRVDDDGTVWVRTSDGERSVGSYPGAGAPEALAYFGRKFDELVGQMALLEQRVAAGGVSPQDAESSVKHLREAVTDANAVGDIDTLLARLDALTAAVAVRRARREAERAAARKRATATKERIVADAESLSESTDWKRTGDRLRELLDEWKAAPRLERKVDDALWKRFSHARTAFDKRRRVHFAELEEERGEAAVRKEKLIKEAEELSTSKEWGDTAKRYRDLMAQWKAAGRARRDVEDTLWARFRAAQDTFFAARSEVFASRDSELAVALETKRGLLVEAEALLPVTDYKVARATMRSVHERWEAAGHVPRANRDEVENRLKKVDDALRSAEDSAWASSNPEARARAEATVSQLRSSIAGLEKEAATARAAGDERKAAEAEAAAATRLTWLVEAERTLTEFS